MEDESLRIRNFDAIPSAEEFVSQIESKNVPAVFIGCVKNWEAFCTWNFSNGGLDYLQRLVGSTTVEAMLSKSAPVFYGDIRSHERVPLPFSTFIGYCKEIYQQKGENRGICSESDNSELRSSEAEQDYFLVGEASQQVYLAQVPIMNMDDTEKVHLEILRKDIQMPTFLETKTLASINLWMNSAQTRSSTHYDPHHNLLCVVTGSKEVVLWPPSASPVLYPMPLYGEASNHSAVSIEKPDFAVHPRAEHSIKYLQRVLLHAGDALFIPEGWFHQVDSDKLTIAVNFWWRSEMMRGMSEHMDAYYLRRILKRLVDKEMNGMLHKTSTCESKIHSKEKSDNYSHDLTEACNVKIYLGNKVNQGTLPHDLDPSSLRSLHDLISLVHDRVSSADVGNAADSVSGNDSPVVAEGKGKKFGFSELYCLEDDPVANFIWALQPLTLQKMFLAMAHHFPRTLEALVLHLLSPVGAEVLTRKFDEIDELNIEEDRNEFYRIFYGVFDNQFAAMDALLNGKELFAHQAFQNVLDKYLGVNV